jgi:hypothetical protein
LALGRVYHEGQGVKADNIEAYKWFKLAQLQGVSGAEKELTNCAVALSLEQINAAEGEVKQFQTRPRSVVGGRKRCCFPCKRARGLKDEFKNFTIFLS